MPRDVASGSAPRVAILMATYNGARFLAAQLGSIGVQDHPLIDIVASDDGSTDDTGALLTKLGAAWRSGAFRWRQGPQKGFAENFRALLTDPAVSADYLAFCDQDDLWEQDKLAIAVRELARFGDRPALFCSRTLLIDETDRVVGESPDFRRPPSFGNALVQSLAGGNTMVFNRAAHRLLAEAARRTGFVSHDWFAYQLISGAGGEVIFSRRPLVRYRQHGGNLVGANRGVGPLLARLAAAFGGRFTRWNDENCRTLLACRDLLTKEARAQFDLFRSARGGSVAERLGMIRAAGLFRQTPGGQFALYAAALFGKV